MTKGRVISVSQPSHRYRFLLTLTNFLTRVMFRLILYICFLQFQLLQWFPLSMHQQFPFVLIEKKSEIDAA